MRAMLTPRLPTPSAGRLSNTLDSHKRWTREGGPVTGHPPVAVAVLCLRNRLRSAKGAQEQLGANVRTKTGLNRSLSRAG